MGLVTLHLRFFIWFFFLYNFGCCPDDLLLFVVTIFLYIFTYILLLFFVVLYYVIVVILYVCNICNEHFFPFFNSEFFILNLFFFYFKIFVYVIYEFFMQINIANLFFSATFFLYLVMAETAEFEFEKNIF